MKRHWFLPQAPDVLGTLNEQSRVTVAGMGAYAAWAEGDAGQAQAVRDAEHAADDVRRQLAQQLRVAFTTPVDAEDLFTLSERLDSVLNMAKNVVREADLLGQAPVPATAELAHESLAGVQALARAIAALPADPTTATEAADAATKHGRHMEKCYARAVAELLTDPDVRASMLLREHLRDCLTVGERIELVADRVWYAVVKEQ